ncbi:conjugal transfer protein TraI [Mucilaginibacter sp. dw_454]|uniref:conjugal transfer protein TraI n=1 Tax=Mucilaginibacter sp. dw_454 TaxID=2720079 RepID=UPI001BD43228|nr:conjugal transfer protein TraI [Mucilaginibacter sp. dw_454]
MKKIITIIVFIITLLRCCAVPQVQAQIPGVSIITGLISKVIRAIDLQIQKQQNQVIWLQNAQKTLENTMSQLKLNDISQWADKQKQLYADYFNELKKVKTAITTYTEVKDMINRQKQLISEYNTTWNVIKQDNHFTPQELQYMYSVYSGILSESLKNIEQLDLAVTNLTTQMTDGKRLELIHRADKSLDKNVSDMRSFNDRNIRLSLARANDEQQAAELKQLYGVQ